MKRYKLTTVPSWDKPKTRLGRVETHQGSSWQLPKKMMRDERASNVTRGESRARRSRMSKMSRSSSLYRSRYGCWDRLSQPKLVPLLGLGLALLWFPVHIRTASRLGWDMSTTNTFLMHDVMQPRCGSIPLWMSQESYSWPLWLNMHIVTTRDMCVPPVWFCEPWVLLIVVEDKVFVNPPRTCEANNELSSSNL